MSSIVIRDSRHLTPRTRLTIEQVVTYIFAPIFFASVALCVNFIEAFEWDIVLIVLAVAIAGKAFGCYAGARLAGMRSRENWAAGFGMSAPGAMEIILGQIALSCGLITDQLFVAIVVMAIVTSMTAEPMMQKAFGFKRGRRLLDVMSRKQFFGVHSGHTREGLIRELS